MNLFFVVYSGKLYGDEMFVEERHRHRYEVSFANVFCAQKLKLKQIVFLLVDMILLKANGRCLM